MADAIVFLKEDHKVVERLFKKLEALGDGATKSKRNLVDEILDELAVHAAIEERVFYTAIREVAKDEVLEGYEEHHVFEQTMAELRDLDVEAENFDAKVGVLMEMVRHHVEEEEQDMFPKVREAMGRNELKAIGERLEQAKALDPYPSGDTPATPRTSDRL